MHRRLVAFALSQRLFVMLGVLLVIGAGAVLLPGLPIKNLEELSGFIVHDWTKINPQRSAWIEKFNKEMAK